jgi:RNase adaptor protein for sRNA GlmZ degradation
MKLRKENNREKPTENIAMKRILITGMSGTGKSSVTEELKRRGYEAIETDSDEWCEWKNVVSIGNKLDDTPQPDWVWREDKLQALLQQERQAPLFVSGCTSNQGKFYPMFEQVILFSASLEVMLHRVATRQNNPYGKRDDEREEIIHYTKVVEPLLRSGCDIEIDTSQLTVQQIADKLISLAEIKENTSSI